MAYMDQQKKNQLAPKIREVLKKYDMKGTIAVRHHSVLVVNLRAGKLDLCQNFFDTVKDSPRYHREDMVKPEYIQVNPYWYMEHFSGECLEFLEELIAAMMKGNHNNSDIQSDYHDVGWYIDVNIGSWDKPYTNFFTLAK